MVKKQNGLKVFCFIIVFVALIGLLNDYLNNQPHNFCRLNPDKCVCEEYRGNWIKVEDHTYSPDGTEKGECKPEKLRKKTQAELDIDDCNNNPREDEKCKCEETKNTYEWIRGFACPNSCRQVTISKCKISGIYHYNEKLEFEGIILYDDVCKFSSPISEITHGRNVSIQIIKENITNCDQCFEYKQICIKSKTIKQRPNVLMETN